MKGKDKPKDKRKRGQPSPYNPEIHDKSIQEILSAGRFVESFCVLHDLDESTYQNWRKANPTFRAASDKGRMAGKVVWLEKPLNPQEKSFSHQYWHIIMRNCYGFDKPPVIPNDATKTSVEFLEKVIDLYCKGNITDSQLDKLVMATESKVKVRESEDTVKRVEEIEAWIEINRK